MAFTPFGSLKRLLLTAIELLSVQTVSSSAPHHIQAICSVNVMKSAAVQAGITSDHDLDPAHRLAAKSNGSLEHTINQAKVLKT